MDYGLKEINEMDFGLKKVRWNAIIEVDNVTSGGEVEWLYDNVMQSNNRTLGFIKMFLCRFIQLSLKITVVYMIMTILLNLCDKMWKEVPKKINAKLKFR